MNKMKVNKQHTDYKRKQYKEIDRLAREDGNSQCETKYCTTCQWNIGACEGFNSALNTQIKDLEKDLEIINKMLQ
jgi:hypothetical protein